MGRFLLATLTVLTVALAVAYAPPQAPAHGAGATVTNHHRWLKVASCEHGYARIVWDYNGKSGFDGGLQFHPGTWRTTVTGRPRLSRYRYAWQAPPWAQIAAANLLKRKAGLGQWPNCGRRWHG